MLFIYGATVTSIVHDSFEIKGGEWLTMEKDITEELQKYNDQYNRVLFYPWG